MTMTLYLPAHAHAFTHTHTHQHPHSHPGLGFGDGLESLWQRVGGLGTVHTNTHKNLGELELLEVIVQMRWRERLQHVPQLCAQIQPDTAAHVSEGLGKGRERTQCGEGMRGRDPRQSTPLVSSCTCVCIYVYPPTHAHTHAYYFDIYTCVIVS